MFNLLSRIFRSFLSGSETTTTTTLPPPAPLSSPEVFFEDEEGDEEGERIQISLTPPPPASPNNLFPTAPTAGTMFVYQWMWGEVFCNLLGFRREFAEIFIPETGAVLVVPKDQLDVMVIWKTPITADQLG